ncbi:hypothetical protein LEN26_011368 [Aphanomyces euteiches]|nr:hypothetical protein LEN26_011368 [Aphanomyces euteiches]KAH9126088.1 hypothetical protein AeMF1_003426 [Aphanomyces euteiches]KAH9189632.1 hypothetical protein AeNC1_008393 [Aphanomyces euteiches]
MKSKAKAPAAVPAAKRSTASKAKSLKDRILYIVKNSATLVSLPKIKKRLQEEFDLEPSTVLNTRVKKALQELIESDREDFGKVGGSYHGGEDSAAYLAHMGKAQAQQDEESHRAAGHVLCCYCNTWADSEFIDEDSVARGSKQKCENCKKTYWTWISDGYSYGHEVEYRYGDGYEDYKDCEW